MLDIFPNTVYTTIILIQEELKLARLIVVLTCISLLVGVSCSAATITVDWDGSGDYTTIQAAIDDANDLDTIVVAEGTYVENISFGGKNIVVRAIDPNDPEVVAATIIDGNDVDTVVRFDGTETSTCKLLGFTITNGYGPADGDGGGITGQGSATISRCIIRDNVAQRHGGGIRGENNFYGLIDRCIITGNSTVNQNGGGIVGCHGTISNCLIYNNTATLLGGAMVNCNGAIVNCTIVDNIASDGTGGIYACDGTTTNCIIWGNLGITYDQLENSSIPTYSCIQDWPRGGTGNISTDPEFIDPCSLNYHLQPWSPCIDAGTNSPPAGLPSEDLEGTLRPIDGDNDSQAIADMGCYESLLSPDPVIKLSADLFLFATIEDDANLPDQILTVRNSGMGTLNWEIADNCDWLDVTPLAGSSAGEPNEVTLSIDVTGLEVGLYSCQLTVSAVSAINTPQIARVYLYVGIEGPLLVPLQYATIQEAVDAASDGDVIILLPQIHNEGQDNYVRFRDKSLTVRSADPDDPQVVAATVIEGVTLDFEGEGEGEGESPNYVLEGLTIVGGWWINADYVSLTVRNCSIRDMAVGLTFWRCNVEVIGCTIADNGYWNSVWHEVPSFCIEFVATTATVKDSTITGNYGVGIDTWESDVDVSNCLIAGNIGIPSFWWETGSLGGGINNTRSNVNVSNCTITGNEADFGGGIFSDEGETIVTNSIIRDNVALDGPQIALTNVVKDLPPSPITLHAAISYSNIQGGRDGVLIVPDYWDYIETEYLDPNTIDPNTLTWEPGNIDLDPNFVKPGYWDPNGTPDSSSDDLWVAGDYHLWSQAGRWDPNTQSWVFDPNTSSCIDASDPNSDWTEEFWPHGKRINMGAYGGTAEASMSLSDVGNIADLNEDDEVESQDLCLFGYDWLRDEVLLKSDLDRNGRIDLSDFSIMTFNWLWEEQ